MKLPSIHPLFYIAVIGLLVMVLITKKWQCAPAYHGDDKLYLQEQKRIRDSAGRENEHQAYRYRQDSTRWTKEKDTFRVKLAATYNLLTASQRKSAGLSATVKSSKANNDTSNYIHACDSLAEENANLNYLINEYVVYSDTVSRANDSLLKVTQARTGEVEKLNKLLFWQGAAADDKYNKLYRNYEKVSKKAGRKWTVGLGAGYGIGLEGKLQPVIGITLSRTLLKF
jgi:hypothetical protein